MIKTQALYDLYNESNRQAIDNRLHFIDEQHKKVKEYFPKVEEVKSILSMYVNYEHAINGKVRELPQFVLDENTTQIKYANMVLKTYYDLRQPIIMKSKEIKELTKQKIPYSVFRFILKSFNEKVGEFITETGRAFEDPILGAIKIKYKENIPNAVNWGKSNANKEKLIAMGKTPYKKEDALKAEEEGRAYDGIKWLVAGYEKGMLMVKWSKSEILKDYIGDEFKFVKYYPARGKYGIVSMLSAYYAGDKYVDFNKYEKTGKV